MRGSRFSALLIVASIVVVASAHVTVQPRQIAAGSGGEFTIRVPTERAVPTVKIRVEFPDGLRVSRLKAKVGWTVEAERDTAKVITAATWSGGRIGPDEYDDFHFNARVIADAGQQLAIKAYQTYEGGEVVGWIDAVDPKAARPAPRITINAVPSQFATAARENWMGGAALLLGFVALTMSMRNARAGKQPEEGN